VSISPWIGVANVAPVRVAPPSISWKNAKSGTWLKVPSLRNALEPLT
jgi:hypothetical protein